jgi:uncharacterized protein DUF4349
MRTINWVLCQISAVRRYVGPRAGLFLTLFAAGVIVLAGCAAREMAPSASSRPAQKYAEPGSAAGAPGASPTRVQPVSAVSRKIVYNAEVDLAADNLTTAEGNLRGLVRAHQGFLAEADITGAPGAPRQGRWKVRVPAGRFDAFMAEVVRLGELQRIHSDSEDVTEEYYDLEARLSNKRVEEQRLLKHLRDSTARLQDILAVERELSRVREEVERLQGRLRQLGDLTELSTVTVTINEIKDYVPAERTTFIAQVGRTFIASLGLLRDTAQGLALVLVALLPWLAVVLLVAVPVWWVFRRRMS